MNLEGNYTFANAPRTLVWDMFLDPVILAAIMPGCERLERVGENVFEGEMKLKVGPVQGVFQGVVELSHLNAPEIYHMKIKGKGPQGIVDGSGEVRLEETDAGTVMFYNGVAQVSGRIASVGQRLMDSSARAITRQSLQNLDAQVQARLQPQPAEPQVETIGPAPAAPPPLPAAAPLPPPSQRAFALGVAREVAQDLLPEDKSQRILFGLVGLAGVHLVFNLVVNWWARKLARRIVEEMKRQG